MLRRNKFHFQVEFGGGALRCGEYVTIRKVGDASQKVATFDNTSSVLHITSKMKLFC